MPRALMAMVALLVLAACATSAGGRARGARDVITAQEIAATTAQDAYELIARLRPRWLQSRGAASIRDPTPQLPVVYVDRIRMGGLEVLRNLNATDILELRYYSAPDATTRYGTDHAGGVIEVYTRRE